MSILDDIFQWAEERPNPSRTTAKILFALTTTRVIGGSLVSYTEGTLFYRLHESTGIELLMEEFVSGTDQAQQYFSDRRSGSVSGITHPFSADSIDPLGVTITKEIVGPKYTVSIKSLKWGFTSSFTPNYDEVTQVVYGAMGTSFATLSFGKRRFDTLPA